LEKKWKQRFSNRNLLPSHIGGLTDAKDIADQLKQAFSDHCFDSYDDKDNILKLCAKLTDADNSDVLGPCIYR